MQQSGFTVAYPSESSSCVVFASPHSGRNYPNAMLKASVLRDLTIRSSEDAFVDKLFACAPDFGAPLLCADHPRAYVDLNRSPDELDPALIEGVRKQGHNPRVASGLGVIPRVVANGRAIYRGKISMQEAAHRLDTVWHPYHAQLAELLNAAYLEHGQTILVDCHSMPREAVESVSRSGMRRPDVVLGDRFGAAASADVVDRIEEIFKVRGFSVARNSPFAGAYITQTYGRPAQGRHAVQVELDRGLYMDESRIVPNENFNSVADALRDVVAQIANIGNQSVPLAAE